ncbi:MAG: DegT/DnrJ/EryC1/StrS family aminotransferase [Rhodospirillales bacterium]
MKNAELAINGGTPVRSKPFPMGRNIGDEERAAVNAVLDGDVLSGYLGKWHDNFYGGTWVQKLEREWESRFKINHAVSVNSASSALQCAIAAAGLGPGDEVIVTPYSMIISATCVFATGAVPVFADIDPRTFCISSETIEKRITPRTKAIVVVQLYGNTSDMDEIMALADKHDLIVIEDAAQAPGGTYKGRLSGTIGHIGVFSLNVHKTISSGEGGILVTNDDEYAERARLVRNHGEVVVGDKGTENIVNMVGYNFRMCEIEAAIAYEQLKKLEQFTQPRIEAAEYLSERLADMPGITPPYVPPEVRHVWYMYGFLFDANKAGMSRKAFVEAMNAEGIPMVEGYLRPIYFEPLFQRKVVFGDKGFPYTCGCYGDLSGISYDHGICPNVEVIEREHMINTAICRREVSKADLDDVVTAFDKVLASEHG